jgi:hypothetical protein
VGCILNYVRLIITREISCIYMQLPCSSALRSVRSQHNVLSRAINFGRQGHFKIWLDCHNFKKFPCLIMPTSTKCQKIEKKMSYNMMIGYDIYDCFTMEHFRLRQRMTLTTKIYCSRLYNENLKLTSDAQLIVFPSLR